jgi:methylated-DNA-[protein]-cysteine S-methyltransferase
VEVPLTLTLHTPIGPLSIRLDGDVVVETLFDPDARVSRSTHPVADAIGAYFEGDIGAIDPIPVSIPGDGFRARAQRALRDIAAGRTVSYAELARAAGSPNAVRAAGSACAANPIGLIVPCHRVLRTGGGLGGYAGGLDRKRWLLDHERHHAGELSLFAR